MYDIHMKRPKRPSLPKGFRVQDRNTSNLAIVKELPDPCGLPPYVMFYATKGKHSRGLGLDIHKGLGVVPMTEKQLMRICEYISYWRKYD